MKRHKILSVSIIAFVVMMTSCVDDLNTKPLNKITLTSASIYDNPASYKEFLAKLYGAMTLTGQEGQSGKPEIVAPDEGTTSYTRMLFTAQEITTDECISAWGDAGITEYHSMNWSAQNGYINLLYQRIFINIAYCNEYIREVTPRISGLSTEMQASVTQYIAEARFLRAMFYYNALDLWGNVPFVTEKDAPGAYLPKQILRKDLFAYVESELIAVIPGLADPGTNEYARADKAAAYTVLARLYLNAEVYTGTARYTDCITYCNKIISTGKYSLNPSYANLFLADNSSLSVNSNNSGNEIIMPIAEDGANSQDYGGVTFIIHAAVGGSEDAANAFGISSGGWAGNRPTNAFVSKFADVTGKTDSRAMFYTKDQTLDITQPLVFTQGYLSTKWKNVTSTGALGANNTFVDTDFPLLRLSDVYLMYAESVVRGGSGGTMSDAVNYVNLIRTRAYTGSTSGNGNITANDLTLSFLIDERGRELFWECQRRTDLIRFGLFTGDAYVWDWKGNVKTGLAVDSHYNIFPLPSTDMAINTNLVQNPGY